MNTLKIEGNSIILNFPMETNGHVSWVMEKLLHVLEEEAKITNRLVRGETSFPVLEGRIGKRCVFSTNLIPK